MEYYAQNQRDLKFRETFRPKEARPITVQGEPLFTVNHRIENEKTVQWKVYKVWGVDLHALARNGVEYRLALTFHKDRQGRDIQVMSATLINPATGDEMKLFDAPETASDFVSNVIGRSWTTVRQAPDGNVDNVELDFEALAFKSDRFEGKLRQMLVGEDEANCYISGRWWLRNDRKGDVYFTIGKQSPEVIIGYSTLDGEEPRKQYEWKSQ